MTSDYLMEAVNPVPQSEPIIGKEDDMEKNYAGGYGFKVDDFVRLQRFLILGSENGSYYVGERKLTVDNARCVSRCIKKDPRKTMEYILQATNNAPKNDTCLFALAMMASVSDVKTRKIALSTDTFGKIVRIPTHLFQFISYLTPMRGWSRGLRNTISHWYVTKRADQLAYHVTKYRNRLGWTHRDMLRKSHALAHPFSGGDMPDDMEQGWAEQKNSVFNWVTKGELTEGVDVPIISAFEEAKTANKNRVIDLITEHNMTWEMLPTNMLKKPEVWGAMLRNMPVNAMLRNLGRMTSIGTLGTFKDNNQFVIDKLSDEKVLASSRLHPLSVLIALLQYSAGHGSKGSMKWKPVGEIKDVLDDAFEKSFEYAPQTNKRFYLGLDVSGSMWSPNMMGIDGLTPIVATACLSMAIARREPRAHLAGFSHEMHDIKFTRKDTIQSAVRTMDDIIMGNTDCSLPMRDARERGIPVDCFIVITDYETWSGRIHPADELKRYRREMGIPAKLIVIGLVSSRTSIADPADAGMLDIVGFDASIPRLIHTFVEDGLTGV